MWTRQFGTAAGDNARRVTVRADGAVLVVGSTEGTLPGQISAGGFDVFLTMFDPDGTQLWQRQFGSGGDDFGVTIGTDLVGHITIAGSTDGASAAQPSGTTFVRHLDAEGSVVWTRQFGTSQSDDAWDVAVDGAGAAYLVGTTGRALSGQQPAGRLDAFVRKYSADGRELWTRQFGTSEDDSALSVALGPSGIAVAGSTRGALAGEAAGELDAYVKRLTTTGAQ